MVFPFSPQSSLRFHKRAQRISCRQLWRHLLDQSAEGAFSNSHGCNPWYWRSIGFPFPPTITIRKRGSNAGVYRGIIGDIGNLWGLFLITLIGNLKSKVRKLKCVKANPWGLPNAPDVPRRFIIGSITQSWRALVKESRSLRRTCYLFDQISLKLLSFEKQLMLLPNYIFFAQKKFS
jgi:hypothetical protein